MSPPRGANGMTTSAIRGSCRGVRTVLAALLGSLVLAATASARPFAVTGQGNTPSVAVDARGTAHVVWDEVAADETSTTHYCQVPRAAATCVEATHQTFAPILGDTDFTGPRVFLAGSNGVVIATARCCSSEAGPDGQVYSSRVYVMRSQDRGRSFAAPAWIGTQEPGFGAALDGTALVTFATGDSGAALQASPLDGFAGALNPVSSRSVISGGVGVSPKGNVVAFSDAANNLFVAALTGDPNSAALTPRAAGRGSDAVVTSGPKGVDVLYLAPGKDTRYFVRRFVNRRPGPATAVSELGFPVFGTATQDALGRAHVAWVGERGLTYRRSAPDGRRFAAPRTVSTKFDFFALSLGANAKGQAAVVYDSNRASGRVGGFTVG